MRDKISVLLISLLFIACDIKNDEGTNEFIINFEKIELENGLDVIFHVDKSDPVVAVE